MEDLLPFAMLALVIGSRAAQRRAARAVRGMRSEPEAGAVAVTTPTRSVPAAPGGVPVVGPAPIPAPALREDREALVGPARRPRRRRLAVGRDLIATELLAPPVALRRGDPTWR